MWEIVKGQRANAGQFTADEKPMIILSSGYAGRITFNTCAVKTFGFCAGQKVQFFANEQKTKMAFTLSPDAQVDFCTMQPYKSNHTTRITSKPIGSELRSVYGINDDSKKAFKIELNQDFYELTPLT